MEISAELITALATAVGVIISVLALRSQLKQIEKSIRGSTYQSIANNLMEIQRLFIDNPGLSKIWGPQRSVWYEPDEDPEKAKLRYTGFLILDFYENLYYQYMQGTIPEEMWSTWRSYLVNDLRKETGFMQQMWNQSQSAYYSKFREEINSLVEKE